MLFTLYGAVGQLGADVKVGATVSSTLADSYDELRTDVKQISSGMTELRINVERIAFKVGAEPARLDKDNQ